MDDKSAELPLATRVVVLEHKVRLISLVLKWLIAGIISALTALVIKW